MLTMGFVTDPEHWRERAEDMRLTARSLMDERARRECSRLQKATMP
jgi:hypothetical protein